MLLITLVRDSAIGGNSCFVYWTLKGMNLWLCISMGRIRIFLVDGAPICGYNIGT
jgi:hypothetical protein